MLRDCTLNYYTLQTQLFLFSVGAQQDHAPFFCVFLWAEVSQKTVLVTSLKQEVEGCSPNRPFAVGFERGLLLNKISRLALNFELYNFTGIIYALTATLHTN